MQRYCQCLLVAWLLHCVALASERSKLLHTTPNASLRSQHNITNFTIVSNVVHITTSINYETHTSNNLSSILSPTDQRNPKINNDPHTNRSCYPPSAALQCFHDPIFCEKHFTSGKRELRNERPKYGEYSSLKHQRWFHVIQHGGIAFLFHPSTEKKEVEKLRQVASRCLHRYVLAPYNKLNATMPLALVSWGCFYISAHVDPSQMRLWIRKHAYSGPASHVHTNGKFQKNLVKQSKVITDEKDAILCPNREQKKLFTPVPVITAKRKSTHHNPESIINNRVKNIKKQLKAGIEISANITVTKVETGSAVWAAASLIFLCGILVGWLLYTRQWSTASQGDYKYDPLRNAKDSFECEPGQSQFNLLKSSQKFMSVFRLKEKEGKEDGLSKVNLMVPINEEDDCEDVLFER